MTNMERHIDEVMDSLRGIGKATPKPFFYTRLEARLRREEKSVWERVGKLVARPAVAALSVSLVLILNTYVVVKGFSIAETDAQVEDVATAEDLHAPSFYDFENNQP